MELYRTDLENRALNSALFLPDAVRDYNKEYDSPTCSKNISASAQSQNKKGRTSSTMKTRKSRSPPNINRGPPSIIPRQM